MVLMTSTAVGSILVSGPLAARTGSAEIAQAERLDFDIPAQPLGAALIEFGRQAGLQVSTDTALARGLDGNAVKGGMDWRTALESLLAGTGLTYRLNGTMVSLVRIAGTGGDTLELAPVQVEASTGTPYEPVAGFVASDSAVATKTSTPILETPQAVSVVSRDEIAVRNAQTDAQTLLYVPGVWAQPFGGQRDPNNPFFYIRGFSSAFGGSYVDGVVSPVNYRYEPFGVERLDIFRGPTSALYGQSDPGGMVNRTTKRPTEEFQGELLVQGGTFDRKQVAADVGGPIDGDKRFLYRLTGLARDSDAPMDYDFGQRESDDRTYLAPAFTVRPGEDTSFTLLTSYLTEEIDAVSVVRDGNGDLTRINLEQPGLGFYDTEQAYVGYVFEHRFDDDVVVRQNARWSTLDTERLGLYQSSIDTATTTVNRVAAGFAEERDDFVIDTHVEGRIATGSVRHIVLGGVDYQRLEDDYSFSYGSAPSLNYARPDYGQSVTTPEDYLRTNSRTSNVGIYLQEQAKIGNHWVATAGLRHDWSRTETTDELEGGKSEIEDRKFTYRAGLNYVTDGGLSPYVSYATSFFPSDGTDIDGTPFEPTTGEQYEVGVKYRPPGFNGFFSAAVYQLTRQNVTTPDPDNPNFSVQTGEVRSRGLELEGTVDLADGLRATVAYSYNDAEITKDNPDAAGVSDEGNRPNLTPSHMASGWIDYTVRSGMLEGLLVGGGVRYVGASYADTQNTIRNGSYTLFDAVVRYDLGQLDASLAGASLALNVDNLLDKEYAVCFNAFDCNWGTRRTVVATLRCRW